MEFKVPKKHILSLRYPLTWSNGFCGERGNKGINLLLQSEIESFFLGEEKMKTSEYKRMVKL
jgi:hypothetical protein